MDGEHTRAGGGWNIPRPAIAVMMLGFWLGLFIAQSISAHAVACGSVDWAEQARDPTNFGRGVRTTGNGMRVSNTVVNCERVSSLFDKGSSANFVEIGWYEHGFNISSACATTLGTPTVFAAARVSGTFRCSVFGQLGAGLGNNFRVEDANRDTTWFFVLNGNTLTSMNVDHSTGEVQTNGERADDVESIFSEFFGMQRMNASQTYVNWQGTDTGGATVNNDPDYETCIQSNTHISVRLVC